MLKVCCFIFISLKIIVIFLLFCNFVLIEQRQLDESLAQSFDNVPHPLSSEEGFQLVKSKKQKQKALSSKEMQKEKLVVMATVFSYSFLCVCVDVVVLGESTEEFPSLGGAKVDDDNDSKPTITDGDEEEGEGKGVEAENDNVNLVVHNIFICFEFN